MESYSTELVLISALLGWGLILIPASIVRFGVVRKPLQKGSAIAFCVVAWLAWMAFGAATGEPINQGGLFLLLLATYFLLRAGSASSGTNTEPSAPENGKSAGAGELEPEPDRAVTGKHDAEDPHGEKPLHTPPISNQRKTKIFPVAAHSNSSLRKAAGEQGIHIMPLAKGLLLLFVIVAVVGIGGLYFIGQPEPPRSTENTGTTPHWWDAPVLHKDSIDWWNDNQPHVVSAISEWAQVGNLAAQFNLAHRLSQGRGTLRDPYQAYCWYKHAGGKGHASAMNNLGLMYWRGETTEVNRVKAHALFNIASVRGSESAATNRDRIEREMSATDQREAVEMARNWDDSGFLRYGQHSTIPATRRADGSLGPESDLERPYSCDDH